MKMIIAKTSVRWRKRLIKLGGVLLVLLILLILAAPRLIGWIIGHELHSQLATRMNARLDFSKVVYQYPYGVLVEKAHLLMPATNGGVDSWIDIGRLELKLAKLPLGAGPLVIEKLAIDHPTVHLASSAGSTTTAAPAAPPASAGPSQKLSDLFRLKNVSVSGGRFEYDFSDAAHPAPPIVWGNLNVNMNTAAEAGGLYQFAIAIADQPVVTAKVTGSFDIDSLQLNADTVAVGIACDPAQPAAQIPPQGQAFIQKYQVAGELAISGNASVPLHDANHATFIANVDLTQAHCQPPGFAGPVTPTLCTIRTSRQGGPCLFDLKIQDQDLADAAASGSVDLQTLLLDLQKLSIKLHCEPGKAITQLPASVSDSLGKMKTGGEVNVDAVARVPLLTPLRGWYAARASLDRGQIQPGGFSGPLTPANVLLFASNVTAKGMDSLPSALPQALPVAPADSHVWLKNLSASCGNQLCKIDSGEVIFSPVDANWTARKFHGLFDIGDGPGPLEGANTRIYLPFVLSGKGRGMDPSSSIRLALDDASASLTPSHVHLNRINGMLTATPTGLRTSGLVAKCAEGIIKATVNLDWQPAAQDPPVALTYDGDAQIQQLDLHQLAMEYTPDPAVRQQAFGQLDFNVKYQGSILQNSPASGTNSPADRLFAQGDFDITHGHFIDIPILRDLLIAMHSPSGSTVGEAAATFDISHSVANLDRTGASSPVLGIQGSGTITFAQQVNMIFVATPLADWAKDVKGAGLLSDVGAAIIGKAQDVVNGLQRAIYQFRVTGDLSKPKVDPVVVPFLSDKMGPLFQKMAGDQSQGSVAQGLKDQKNEGASK
jgi:hypothetical protein